MLSFQDIFNGAFMYDADINTKDSTSIDYNKANNVYKFFGTFLLIQIMGLYLFRGIRTIFPIFLQFNLNYSKAHVIIDWGIIYSIGQFLGFLTRPTMGILADHLPRSVVLTISLITCIIAVTGMLITESIFVLAILFGLLRVGTNIIPLVTRQFVIETNPKRHGRLNSLLQFAARIGSILGPIVLTFLFDASLFFLVLITSVMIFFTIIFIVFTVPKKSIENKTPLKLQIRTSLSEVKRIKKILLIYLLAGSSAGIFATLLVPYGLYVFKLSPTMIGLLVGIIPILSLAGIVIIGELVDKIGTKPVLLISLIIECLGGVFVFLSSTNIFVFIISQIFLQVGVTAMNTSAATYMSHNVAKIGYSTTFGIASGMMLLGASITPQIASSLFLFNSSLPYLIISIFCILIFPLFYFIKFENRKENFSKNSF